MRSRSLSIVVTVALTGALSFTTTGFAYADPVQCTVDDEPVTPGASGIDGDEDDNVIVCTGDVSFQIDGDEGNDTISVEGNLTGDIVGGPLSSDEPGPDDDTITVTGFVSANYDDPNDETPGGIGGGIGNDTITTGNIGPYASIEGGEGDDTITTGNFDERVDSFVRGGPGNDKITTGSIAGYSESEVSGGTGDDTITTGAITRGAVRGEAGADVIEAEVVSPSADNGPSKIQGGRDSDRISGIGDTMLTVGPGDGVVDGDAYTADSSPDTCNVQAVGSGEIVNCS